MNALPDATASRKRTFSGSAAFPYQERGYSERGFSFGGQERGSVVARRARSTGESRGERLTSSENISVDFSTERSLILRFESSFWMTYPPIARQGSTGCQPRAPSFVRGA
eukprot:scaffold11647_cov83-Phaeocystis_antarctica.AAC.2